MFGWVVGLKRFLTSKKRERVHVRVDCDKCGRYDCISVYEDQVEHTDFKVSFFECTQCKKTFCHICVEDDERVECPFCKKLKPKKIKPFDIYVCGVCFKHWWREGGFCKKCNYLPEDDGEVDDGTYKGPPKD